ncbi:MAG: hypothetical protein HZC24_00795, partial [Rhodocyclales bacterium]|nr:hypothetical protein [Rhodocyclales bacterium]
MTQIVSLIGGTARNQFDAFQTGLKNSGLTDSLGVKFDALAAAMDSAVSPTVRTQTTTEFTQEFRDAGNVLVGVVTIVGTGFNASGDPFLNSTPAVSRITMTDAGGAVLLQLEGSANWSTESYTLTRLQVGSADLGAQITLTATDLGATVNGANVSLTGAATQLQIYARDGDQAYQMTVGGNLQINGSLVQDAFGGFNDGAPVPGLADASSVETLGLQKISYTPGTSTVASTQDLLTISGLALSPNDLDALLTASAGTWVDGTFNGGAEATVMGAHIAMGPNSSGYFRLMSPLVQNDGHVVVAAVRDEMANGVSTRTLSFSRLNADGTADATFGTDGVTSFSRTFTGSGNPVTPSFAVLADNSFVSLTSNQGGGYMLRRFTADGDLDTAFDTDGDGQVIFGSGSVSNVGVAAQADGKLLAAAAVTTTDGSNTTSIVFNRFNADGSPDTTFNSAATAVPLGVQANIQGISRPMVAADGTILGVVAVSGATGVNLGLARYTASGEPDASFGAGGATMHAITGASYINGFRATMHDGKIL